MARSCTRPPRSAEPAKARSAISSFCRARERARSSKDTASMSAAEVEILLLSLKVALWAGLASLPFALALAMLLARVDFPGKALVDGVVNLPLVLPPVVVGY